MRFTKLCLALMLVPCSLPLHADDSPQFRGPARDGKSAEKGLWSQAKSKEPKLLWTAEGVGQGYASVSVVGDRIYTSGNSGKGQMITAVSAADGKVIWSKPITDKDPNHSYDGLAPRPQSTASSCTPSPPAARLSA